MAVHMVIIMRLRLLSLSFDGDNVYVVQFGSSMIVLLLRRRSSSSSVHLCLVWCMALRIGARCFQGFILSSSDRQGLFDGIMRLFALHFQGFLMDVRDCGGIE